MVVKEFCKGNTRIRIADDFVVKDSERNRDTITRIMMIAKQYARGKEEVKA